MLLRSRTVVALSDRPTVAFGAIADRDVVHGDVLVSGTDLAGRSCWVPAASVWADVTSNDVRAGRTPQRPRPTGLATAESRSRAVLAGLSDRLGAEAVAVLDRHEDLPLAPTTGAPLADHVVVLDGRLGHGVPTVVVLCNDLMCWGAGATWDRAIRRALYGDEVAVDPAVELSDMAHLLRESGLEVVVVDLGTPTLTRAGVARTSVQLTARDVLGR